MAGIARKLSITYVIIIVTTIVSGLFCFYVLNRNQHANKELRYVTLPALDHLNDMRMLNQETKKLANTWVYIANNSAKDRLLNILNISYPKLEENLSDDAAKLDNQAELEMSELINSKDKQILDSVKTISLLLNNTESYMNDSIVDRAVQINEFVSKTVVNNDKLFNKLLETKNSNLERQQNFISKLQEYLYLTILANILTIIAVSFFSLRFSKNQVVDPLLKLNKIILDMAVGDVVAIDKIEREDEIGQMHNATSKMIDGIIQKIYFSEQIGKGAYDTDFKLLSERDKLGLALLTMRNDLNNSHEVFLEQEKRLVDAQKMAKVGNYFLDVKSGIFQSSATLDEILGIDDSFIKTNSNWEALISPEFRDYVTNKTTEARVEQKVFIECFPINRYNDDQVRWLEVIGDRNYDENGKPTSLFGTMQDITQSKTLELELENSYKVATEQNKRLLNFSYIVSHNLRMHAVNIHSLLKMIDETQSDEEVHEFLLMLRTASDMLNETMHHLNDVVAVQNAVSVEIKPLVLNAHINNAFTVLNTQITNKNALIINHVTDDIIIKYNPAYLDSMVLNFISNAIKYGHPDRQPAVNINCYKEHTENEHSDWILEIADNGIGIDLAKHGHKLFGMYKTFHTNKDAKGIGLFLTKYQIEAMGGSVEVESEVGKGTTFRVHIKNKFSES